MKLKALERPKELILALYLFFCPLSILAPLRRREGSNVCQKFRHISSLFSSVFPSYALLPALPKEPTRHTGHYRASSCPNWSVRRGATPFETGP